MGLSDQIFHQSSPLRDSFSHQFIHFWILITYFDNISAALNILVNIGTVLWESQWGFWCGFCCSWGAFVCLCFSLPDFCFALVGCCFGGGLFWWGFVVFLNCSLLTCGLYWLVVVTRFQTIVPYWRNFFHHMLNKVLFRSWHRFPRTFQFSC